MTCIVKYNHCVQNVVSISYIALLWLLRNKQTKKQTKKTKQNKKKQKTNKKQKTKQKKKKTTKKIIKKKNHTHSIFRFKNKKLQREVESGVMGASVSHTNT